MACRKHGDDDCDLVPEGYWDRVAAALERIDLPPPVEDDDLDFPDPWGDE
ncbi:MAG: hypothetical protein HC882_00415 [Acidobacteria bacterium]|nr:hypothetical protein [Acidobacteriota bacterium]